MSRAVTTGSVDQSIRVWAYDVDGAAITGEAYNSAGISVSVVVRSAGRIVSTTALTLVARSGVGVHTDSAFTEVGSGEYVVDLADSYSATANRQVSVTLTSTAIAGGYVLSETLAVGVAVELDSATQTQITAIETFATRITTGIVQDGAVWQFTANMLELGPSGGGGGSATLEKQEEILAAIQGADVIQVASPNVQGNLVLTQGDDYDGIANPRASWTVSTDYTDGWAVTLTIRDADDAVIYTTSGTVVSATVVAVTIAAPTGLTMTGCPGQWQGKFDVELTKSGSKKTIALGTCYINEDQTR